MKRLLLTLVCTLFTAAALHAASDGEVAARRTALDIAGAFTNDGFKLLDVVRLLNERNIHVLAISVQDSADTAIVRIVVSDPESVQQMFIEHAIPFSICDLVVVELKEGATELGRLLAALLAAECNIFGSYALITRPRGRPALALHVEDNECAVS